MKKVYLWGVGCWAYYVYKKINHYHCEILGMIDSDVNKQSREWKYGLMVYSPEHLVSAYYDYIVITSQNYEDIQKKCLEMQISNEKILAYWRDEESREVFKNRSEYICSLENTYKKCRDRLENFPFEYGIEKVPQIKSGVELLRYILNTGCSLSRFGDGEFELMLERPRPWFQSVDKQLACRLREIIREEETENIAVAIADDFGCLEKYTEKAADGIRAYMTRDRRTDIMKFIDLEREYYDAYVTRPYIIYKDKNNAIEIFTLFKQIWKDRNIILVEGKYARIGVGNDLFDDTRSVKRILCPPKNAWGKFEKIVQCIKENAKENDLVCISLGPAATVMAYDLTKAGMQALDIGQLDNEYEWFVRSAEDRISIPNKMVAEVNVVCDYGIVNSEYYAQIVGEVD